MLNIQFVFTKVVENIQYIIIMVKQKPYIVLLIRKKE